MTTVIDASGITKAYEGQLALDDVSLSVDAGEVHGLVGENGAGKSTLIKIMAGAVRRDAGTIKVGGVEVPLRDERESHEMGLRFVHQDLGLVERLTVAENVFLGQPLGGARAMYSSRKTNAAAREILKGFIDVDPARSVAEMSIAQRWMIAIARACDPGARLVVMDEPTVALSNLEVELLFAAIDRLTDAGVAVLLVSHRLGEVLRTCQRVTVMKDGRTMGTHDIGDLDHESLVGHIVGEMGEVTETVRPSRKPGPIVLSTRGLSGGPLRSVDIEIRAGEILGIAGLVGSGRSSLLSTIFGAWQPASGEVLMDSEAVRFRSPHKAVRAGIAMIPEERRQQGLLMSRSIRENIVLAHIDKCRRLPFAPLPSKRREMQVTREQIENLQVATKGPSERVSSLSGGNQQKVLLGRWLMDRDLRVLMLDEPTKGIDVGAKAELFRILEGLADRGVAVVLVSSDLEEIADHADRVVVMVEGAVVAMLDGSTTESEMLSVSYEHHKAVH